MITPYGNKGGELPVEREISRTMPAAHRREYTTSIHGQDFPWKSQSK